MKPSSISIESTRTSHECCKWLGSMGYFTYWNKWSGYNTLILTFDPNLQYPVLFFFLAHLNSFMVFPYFPSTSGAVNLRIVMPSPFGCLKKNTPPPPLLGKCKIDTFNFKHGGFWEKVSSIDIQWPFPKRIGRDRIPEIEFLNNRLPKIIFFSGELTWQWNILMFNSRFLHLQVGSIVHCQPC